MHATIEAWFGSHIPSDPSHLVTLRLSSSVSVNATGVFFTSAPDVCDFDDC